MQKPYIETEFADIYPLHCSSPFKHAAFAKCPDHPQIEVGRVFNVLEYDETNLPHPPFKLTDIDLLIQAEGNTRFFNGPSWVGRFSSPVVSNNEYYIVILK